MINEGRSIVTLVGVDTVDVIEAVVELFEDGHQRALTVESEDVGIEAGGFISEMDESEEFS